MLVCLLAAHTHNVSSVYHYYNYCTVTTLTNNGYFHQSALAAGALSRLLLLDNKVADEVNFNYLNSLLQVIVNCTDATE
jgi:hypothetical protein